jgi:hypothetical protein
MLPQDQLPYSNYSSRSLPPTGILRLVDSANPQPFPLQSVSLPPLPLGDTSSESPGSVHLLPIDAEWENLDEISYRQLMHLSQKRCVIGALNYFARNVSYLKVYHARFSRLDARTEDVVRPILDIQKIVISDIQDRGILVERKIAYLNLRVFIELANFALKNSWESAGLEPHSWLSIALSIYFFHEITHSSQGIPKHEDVKAVKAVNQTSGKRLLVELDLRSDYLAAHTLSILETFQECGSHNFSTYDKWFNTVWCKVCRGMLESFSNLNSGNNSRKDKVRRVFGFLLMAHLFHESYSHRSPIRLNEELLPDWSPAMDRLSIESARQPWIRGEKVDPTLMKKIRRLIIQCKYDAAEEAIVALWKGLPK